VTNPQGPPNDGPQAWGRPGNQGPPGQPQAPTERIQTGPPGPGRAQEPPTTQLPTQAGHFNAARGDAQRPSPPAQFDAAAGQTEQLGTRQPEAAPKQKKRGFFRNPLAILLVVVIVVALVATAVIVGEIIARRVVNGKVAQVVACEVQDQATANFGVAPLLLWQLATKHFTNITVETAGNQIRDARGMKLKLTIQNVQLRNTSDSKGTVGALNADITWTADGIKQSVQQAIPVLGAFVTSSVTTHPADQTIELKGALNDIVAKPVISDGGLSLQIQTFNTLGFSMPKETVQKHLDDFTSDLTKNYPLGIHADTVTVTTTGVESHFSTQNANLPVGNNDKKGCFNNV
jgi:hypothetical protein